MKKTREQMTEQRQLRAVTSQIGLVSVLQVVSAFLRYKVIAVVLGAAGLGVYGILFNLTAVVAALSAMGLAFSLTGALAKAATSAHQQSKIFAHALIVSTVTGVVGGIVALVLSRWVLAEPVALGAQNISMWWVLPCIPIMLWSSLLGAGLMGLQENRKFARASIAAHLIATPIGLLLVWIYGMLALFPLIVWVHFVRAVAMTVALGRSQLLEILPHCSLRGAWQTVRPMLSVGLHFTLGSALGVGSILIAQSIVSGAYGLAASGGLQSVYAVSFQIMGFLLLNMQATLYPKLSAAGMDPTAVRQLSNEHARFVLIVVGVVLLGFNGFSVYIFTILFSSEFAQLATFAGIWFLGDAIKSLAWIPVVSLLAQERNGPYLLSQASAAFAFLIAVALVVLFDMPFDYIAFANVVSALVMLFVAHVIHKEPFASYWQSDVKTTLAVLVACFGVVVALRLVQSPAALPVGIVVFFGFALWHCRRSLGLKWRKF